MKPRWNVCYELKVPIRGHGIDVNKYTPIQKLSPGGLDYNKKILIALGLFGL